MPADSRKKLILKALMEHCRGINPTADDPATQEAYDIDLRAAVFAGRTTFGDSDPKPMLAILEKPTPDENPSVADTERTIRKETWTLLFQGFARDDKENPTFPAYDFMAQVEQRLAQIVQINPKNGNPAFPEVHMLGKLILAMTIGPGVVRPPTINVSATAFFYLPVSVDLKTDVTNPYAA